MDVLTILEELSHHLPQLQDIFHWNITLVQPWEKVNRKPGRYVNVNQSGDAFTSEEMVFLKRVNAIDLELYEFAVLLAQNMTSRALDSIAKRGDSLLPQGGQTQSQGKMFVLRQRVATRLRLRARDARVHEP